MSDVLIALEAAKAQLSQRSVKNRRVRGKQSRAVTDAESLHYVYSNLQGEPLRRSYADAWKDYRCKHVVSKWAARIIQQFNASHLADSLEAAEADDTRNSTRDRKPIDNSWMELNTVRDILTGTASAERRRAGDDSKIQISAHAYQVEAAKSVSEKLWSLPTAADVFVDISNKHQSIISSKFEKQKEKKKEGTKESLVTAEKTAGLVYRNFSVAKANEWLRKLRTVDKQKQPSHEQQACLQEIITRCAVEAREADENKEFRSEPLRMLLHGVPGVALHASNFPP